MKEGIELRREDTPRAVRFFVSGDVDADSAREMIERICGTEGANLALELDLEEMDLADAAAVAVLVDGTRDLLDHFDNVRLLRAPQMLAHNLYRVGMLREGGRLGLIAPRQEEGAPD